MVAAREQTEHQTKRLTFAQINRFSIDLQAFFFFLLEKLSQSNILHSHLPSIRRLCICLMSPDRRMAFYFKIPSQQMTPADETFLISNIFVLALVCAMMVFMPVIFPPGKHTRNRINKYIKAIIEHSMLRI